MLFHSGFWVSSRRKRLRIRQIVKVHGIKTSSDFRSRISFKVVLCSSFLRSSETQATTNTRDRPAILCLKNRGFSKVMVHPAWYCVQSILHDLPPTAAHKVAGGGTQRKPAGNPRKQGAPILYPERVPQCRACAPPLGATLIGIHVSGGSVTPGYPVHRRWRQNNAKTFFYAPPLNPLPHPLSCVPASHVLDLPAVIIPPIFKERIDN